MQPSSDQLFQPATLPPALADLYTALAAANTPATRQQAALAILKEYFNYFGATGMRQDMWQLLTAALTNGHTQALKKGAERANLFFFYEFTLIMMDAAGVLLQGMGRSTAEEKTGGVKTTAK